MFRIDFFPPYWLIYPILRDALHECHRTSQAHGDAQAYRRWITRIKCGMTALISRIYCREVHHTINGELCSECERFFEGPRSVPRPAGSRRRTALALCVSIVTSREIHDMLTARAMFFQAHGSEHQGEVQRIMADGLGAR